MQGLDEILRELRAIEDFDALFLAQSKHCREEVDGFAFRQLRKKELLGFVDESKCARHPPWQPGVDG